MRRLLTPIGLGVLLIVVAGLPAGDGKKSIRAVQEFDVKGVSFMRKGASATKPIPIRSEDDLKKLEGAARLQDLLRAKVNFKRQTALVFAWSGSGQDRVVFKGVRLGQAVFTFTPGLTRDYRPHLNVFTLPAGMKWIVRETKAR